MYRVTITSHLDSAASADQSSELHDIRVLQEDTDEDLNDHTDNNHTDTGDGDHIDGDFDFLTDIEEDKEIYRLKVFIYFFIFFFLGGGLNRA